MSLASGPLMAIGMAAAIRLSRDTHTPTQGLPHIPHEGAWNALLMAVGVSLVMPLLVGATAALWKSRSTAKPRSH
ncbi:MAG: hypothetical protein LBH13_06235 [Cellulomonadaceae bacterium]|nr:hypothetical protein [Cellulomonadaceae bacterium]